MNRADTAPGIAKAVRPVTRALRLARYRLSGRRPWTAGYADVKLATIGAALRSPDLLERFRSGSALPAGYGAGLDERVVEYPWVYARLRDSPGRLLDAGSTLNLELLLNQPRISAKRLTIVTLAPEPSCFWQRGISYDFEDLRALPYRDGCFDEVVSISTLEHVGMDNAMYGAAAGGADFAVATGELARVLGPGGRLLITVPFGRGEDLGFQRVFDRTTLDRLVGSLDALRVTTAFYRYTAEGWAPSDEAGCRDSEYFDVHARGYGSGASIRYDPDLAAAARAIACVEATRPG